MHFVGYSPWSNSVPSYVMVLKRRISLKNEKALYIGDALKPIRLAAGMSQEELAHRAKLDRSYMSNLEKNQKSPSFKTIIKLAFGLEMEPEDLVHEMGKTIDFARFFEEEPEK
jgi:transcriptional regulator with XRE-family HTH domain